MKKIFLTILAVFMCATNIYTADFDLLDAIAVLNIHRQHKKSFA